MAAHPPSAPPWPAAAEAAVRAAEPAPGGHHGSGHGDARYTNRLVLEQSPYLLQHAHNPVDWRPWDDSAFAEAARRGVPVLLSIGYAACHWCHVMAEESFEDEEVAAVLNAAFVAVKVDREERPDVDAVYMAAVQAASGRGGWPLTACLTPGRQPFWVGTYLPARDGDRGAAVGFLTLLQRLRDSWAAERGRLEGRAGRVSAAVRSALAPPAQGAWPGLDLLVSFARQAASRADMVNGGARGAPKFPGSLPVEPLLRAWRRLGDEDALSLAKLTLSRIGDGGITDQLGGGIHRYAIDERWLVPHFEKMLTDNALLAADALAAWQATGMERFAATARSVLAWLDGEMSHPGGGFVSSLDADSESARGRSEEGAFYTWTPAEIDFAAPGMAGAAAREWFGATEEGHHEGRSVLHAGRDPEDVAAALGIGVSEFRSLLAAGKEQLLDARSERPRPLVDGLVIASWNGLAIAAFARAGLVLDDPGLSARAMRAGEFAANEFCAGSGARHSWREGVLSPHGFLEDGAALAWGFLALFEATGDSRWLERAIKLLDDLEERFADRDSGGWFQTPKDGEALLAREKPWIDGAMPSGNGLAALCCARLAAITSDDKWKRRALGAVRSVAAPLAKSPVAAPWLVATVDTLVDTASSVVIVAPEGLASARGLLAPWRERYLPNSVLLPLIGQAPLKGTLPALAGRVAVGGRPTAYVCRGSECGLPATNGGEFAAQLG